MFKKSKERIARLEETNEMVLRVKEHLQDHGEAYLAGAGCFIAGMLVRRGPKPVTVNLNQYLNEVERPSDRLYIGLKQRELRAMLEDPMTSVAIPIPGRETIIVESIR